MKIKQQIKKEVTIHLDEHEVDWLRGIMQNPLHSLYPSDEEAKDKFMRKKFFDACIWKGEGGENLD